VSVTTGSSCTWTASNNGLSWVSVSPSSGSGNGPVSVTVAPNPTNSARTGSVNIANQNYAISQSPNSNGVMALSNGVPVSPIQLSYRQMINYYIDVPANVTTLRIQTWGGQGDVDLYVRYGAQATEAAFDYAAWFVGNDENILIQHPQAGGWYVGLDGFSASSGITLKVQYSTFDWNLFMPAIIQSNVTGQ